MPLDMQKVVEKLQEIYRKPLEKTPVSRDIPRLAKQFTFYLYSDKENKYIEQEFVQDAKSKTKDEVLYKLLATMGKRLKLSCPTPSMDTFKEEVKLDLHETLNTFLQKNYGDESPLVRILRACNQAVIIGALEQVRTALLQHNINFKDCRGQWFLEYKPHKGVETAPMIIQRRIEQVYDVSPNGMFNLLYKFEWEIGIAFENLECEKFTQVGIHLSRLDFSTVPQYSDDQKKQVQSYFQEAFGNNVLNNLDVPIK